MNSIKLAVSVILFILALFLSFIHCEKNVTQKILPENQFVQIYCDVVAYADIIKDESRIAFMDSILKSQNISREDLQRSVAYYSKDSKRWEKIFARVVEELERREREFSAQKDTTRSEATEPLPAVPFSDELE